MTSDSSAVAGGAADDELLARLAELNGRFAAALPATLERLLAARNAFDVSRPQPDLIDLLYRTLHRLAGSSATFGFERLGLKARELETALRALAADPATATHAWAAWLARLDAYVAWAGADPKGD